MHEKKGSTKTKKTNLQKKPHLFGIKQLAGSISAFYTCDYHKTGRQFTDFLLRNRYEISLFILFALINLIYAMGMQYPLLTDEHVTMAEGIFLTGDAEHWATAYAGSNYYGYGYSALYGWLYQLTQDMRLVFKGSLIINSIIISFIPVLGFKISSSYLGIKKPTACLISVLIGMYPAAVVYSKYALNEAVLILIPWLAAFILLYLFKDQASFKKNLLIYALLGALGMYAYTVHGRGIAVFGVAFLCVLFFAIKNKKARYWLWFVVFLASAIAWFLIDKAIKTHLMADFFQTTAENANNTLERVLNVNMANAFSLKNMGSMLTGFFGQGLYMMCATLGLFSVGIAAFVAMLKNIKKVQSPEQKNLYLMFFFAILFALASIVISTTFLSGIYVSDEAVRSEYYVYGRYNETACLILVFVAAAFFAIRKRLSKKLAIASGVIFGISLIVGCTIASQKIVAAGGHISYNMVPSIMPFMGFEAWLDTGYASFAALAIIVGAIFIAFLVLAIKGKFAIAMGLLICCFIYSFNYSLFAFVYPVSEKRYLTAQPFEIFAQQVDGLEKRYPRVYVDFFSPPELGIQFAMPKFEMYFMDKADRGYGSFADIEENSLIVSKHNETIDEIFSDIYQVKANEKTHVWAYGEELAEELRSRGYSVYQNKARFSAEYRAGDIYGNENTVTEGSSIVLNQGGQQFGPYENLTPATYRVEIYGENLDKADFSIKNDGGNVFTNIKDFELKESSHVIYEFTPGGFASDAEFFTTNNGTEPVKIEYITLNITEPAERISAKDGYKHMDLFRDYGVGESSVYRGSDFSFKGETVKGQSGVIMRDSCDLKLSGLFFNPGSHQVTVYGDNIQLADIGFDAEKDFELSDIRSYDGKVVFTLDTDEYIEDGVLHVTNKTDNEITYRGIAMNVLNLTDIEGLEWERGI